MNTANNEALRFSFGQNWEKFLSRFNPSRLEFAIDSLKEKLECSSLNGKTFLDAGSGSGLFSLAALKLGAEVHSFDFDPHSVAATKMLKSSFYPNKTDWSIEEASVLDEDYIKGLPEYDIVYSWGVLHHTGSMWKALENTATKVRPGGKLFIAIYNDQGLRSKLWLYTKKLYNWLPELLRPLVIVPCAIILKFPPLLRDTLKFDPLKSFRTYDNNRGMSAWHDLIDWIGGYPFEVARPEQIFEFLKQRGFTLTKLETVGGKLGCNQFVFQK